MKRMVKYMVLACTILLGSCSVVAKAQTKPVEHTVRWMENIYIIAKKYKTEPQIILDYNNLTANQVRRGVVLLIPWEEATADAAHKQDSLARDEFMDVVVPFNPNDCSNYLPYPGISHSVSLILPLQLTDEQPNSLFIEFYQGFLLAAEDLRQEGMGIILRTLDLAAYPNMPALVQAGALQNQELIIGPVFAEDVFALLQNTYGSEAKIVSPLDPRTEQAVEANPRFFQVSPPPYWQQYNLLQYLEPQSGMVWLFSEEGGRDQALLALTKQILGESQIPYREYNHRVVREQNITDNLAQLFQSDVNNQVIVVSSNEAFVSDLLRNLHMVHSGRQRPITLFGNAGWRNFESVDLDYYHQMRLHLSLSNYIDYERADLKHFLARYRALFQTEPSPYAYQGYDVGYYFLRALYTKGPRFEDCTELIPARPLQSNFRFQKVGPNGGFINTDSRVIRYLPDYRIEVLR
ncbi:MAG: hypothetical protein FWE30_00970 [Bacteroidales bacterium]|nr:hypothetical protein [Bacteroidales bacterium]